MANFFKTILKILLTALLISGLLVAAIMIIIQNNPEYSNSKNPSSDSLQPPSFLIEIDNAQNIISWEKTSEQKYIGNMINEVPMLKDLPVSASINPLNDTPYQKLSWQNRLKLWKTYGKPYIQTKKSDKVAILLIGLGQNEHALDSVTEGMFENISFSLSPYAENVEDSIKHIRKYGHETYLDVILPSDNILHHDTGPNTAHIYSKEVINKIKNNLHVGGIVLVNERSSIDISELLKSLKNSGFLIINATGKQLNINYIKSLTADIVIDKDFYPEDIKKKLEFAEHLAAERGQVIIAAYAKPSVVWAVKRWVDGFGINNILELVPISALVEEEF